MAIQSRKQDQIAYNFVIDSLGQTNTKSAIFYTADSVVVFPNYIVPFDMVKVGDVIYKPKMSYFLIIKRKDENGRLSNLDTLFPRFNFSGLEEPKNKYWLHRH